ncbi:hypothetical protein BH24ACT15_BH24ACT15_38910 [soil metagenome]
MAALTGTRMAVVRTLLTPMIMPAARTVRVGPGQDGQRGLLPWSWSTSTT